MGMVAKEVFDAKQADLEVKRTERFDFSNEACNLEDRGREWTIKTLCGPTTLLCLCAATNMNG